MEEPRKKEGLNRTLRLHGRSIAGVRVVCKWQSRGGVHFTLGQSVIARSGVCDVSAAARLLHSVRRFFDATAFRSECRTPLAITPPEGETHPGRCCEQLCRQTGAGLPGKTTYNIGGQTAHKGVDK